MMLFPLPSNLNHFHNDTLIDGEIIIHQSVNGPSFTFMAFDLIAIDGVSIAQRSFSTRIGILLQDILQPHLELAKTLSNNIPPFKFEMKKHERSYGFPSILLNQPDLRGLVFTPVKAPYSLQSTLPAKLFYWNTPEFNCFSFKVKVLWDKDHKSRFQLWIADRQTHKYYDDFTPDTDLLKQWRLASPEGKIIDCRFDPLWETLLWENGYAGKTRKGGWRFCRYRPDKTTAEDEKALNHRWKSLINPITVEQLEASIDKIRSNWKQRERRSSQTMIELQKSIKNVDGHVDKKPKISDVEQQVGSSLGLQMDSGHDDGNLTKSTKLSQEKNDRDPNGRVPKQVKMSQDKIDRISDPLNTRTKSSPNIVKESKAKPIPLYSKTTDQDQSDEEEEEEVSGGFIMPPMPESESEEEIEEEIDGGTAMESQQHQLDSIPQPKLASQLTASPLKIIPEITIANIAEKTHLLKHDVGFVPILPVSIAQNVPIVTSVPVGSTNTNTSDVESPLSDLCLERYAEDPQTSTTSLPPTFTHPVSIEVTETPHSNINSVQTQIQSITELETPIPSPRPFESSEVIPTTSHSKRKRKGGWLDTILN
ncbi:hypothetical protein BC833DRAFT_268991 [Globomyces pollinis-pini]|nr:hypothetical protein BC833DRAFT_268991 [Globomyces pollinis-pini]